MMRCLFVIIFCAIGIPSWAQDVIVRTGDHPSFSRIVLSMPPETNWELSQVAGGYSLRVDEPTVLNTELFFERIQRNRIVALREGPTASELVFVLACDCFAEAFQWRPDQVVIDIKDPGSQTSPDALPIADLRSSSNFSGQSPQTFSVPVEPSLKRVSLDLPSPPVPTESLSNAPSLNLPLLIEDHSAPPVRQFSIAPLDQLLVQQARVGSLESAISESLGRALSQGLLAPSREGPPPAASEPTQTDLTDLLEDLEAALTPGMIARTSIDRDARLNLAHNNGNPTIACIPDNFVDVPNWAADTPFAMQISDLRNKITGEFDRTDPAAIEALSKAYITFGFGREAISTLSIDGTSSRSRSILRTLAEIIDSDSITVDDFHFQVGCEGHVALWGLLAHQEGPLSAQPDVNNIIVSFKLLPKPLRQHLAPRLARKLNALGYRDFADDVLSIGDKDKIDVATAELEILIDRGAVSEAASQLARLAENDPRTPPEALLRLISIDLAESKPIDADALTLLRTFQFEVQDDELLRELYATEIRVMIQMEAYDSAQNLVDEQENLLTAEAANMFRATINDRFVTGADISEFLVKAFDPEHEVKDTKNQNAFAARLIELGFPERAQQLIQGQAIGDDMMERRYLRAEAAIAMDDLSTAQAHLAGFTTERAQQILSAQSDEEAEETVILQPTEDEFGLLTIAESEQEASDPQAGSQTPLRDGRVLVDESSSLRADMEALLARNQITQ